MSHYKMFLIDMQVSEDVLFLKTHMHGTRK